MFKSHQKSIQQRRSNGHLKKYVKPVYFTHLYAGCLEEPFEECNVCVCLKVAIIAYLFQYKYVSENIQLKN